MALLVTSCDYGLTADVRVRARVIDHVRGRTMRAWQFASSLKMIHLVLFVNSFNEIDNSHIRQFFWLNIILRITLLQVI